MNVKTVIHSTTLDLDVASVWCYATNDTLLCSLYRVGQKVSRILLLTIFKSFSRVHSVQKFVITWLINISEFLTEQRNANL